MGAATRRFLGLRLMLSLPGILRLTDCSLGPLPRSESDFAPLSRLTAQTSGWRTPISRKHLAKVMRKRKPLLRNAFCCQCTRENYSDTRFAARISARSLSSGRRRRPSHACHCACLEAKLSSAPPDAFYERRHREAMRRKPSPILQGAVLVPRHSAFDDYAPGKQWSS